MLSLRLSSALTIKPVGPFDLGRLAKLHRACFDDPWSRADLAHLLALPGGFGLVARFYDQGLDGLRGVGFAICRVVHDESELLSLGVIESFRRRRIASQLLQASMSRCLRDGARLMFLEVAVDNQSGQRLYEGHGFECVGTRTDYYLRPDGTRADAYTMRCELETSLSRLQLAATAPH
ncbi:ribosomal-protein-alanine N-acetyltransferase [Arboricoccus pini]|uniref:Ribosomal-protein-alanine N-acetyltransferase n=1 Tax=Arboricoccus pini TaxID=1963835 RepID=A0A212PYK6_9PROT|nr:GNAT family N-acetyltransferase [Arboricoccus pini]SNB52044.1 ribosomal-protein-alanine N-acetyltransferase [Arboricoccus pini]